MNITKKVIVFIFIFMIISFSILVAQYQKQYKGFKLYDNAFMGYVGNFPQEFIGFNLIRLNRNKAGFYIDLKVGVPMREGADNFYDNISVNKAENIYGDDFLRKDGNWISLNACLTKVITDYIAVYGGFGYSAYSQYRQYYDEFEILGDNGKYWIDDEGESKSSINILAGIFFPLSSLWNMQIGAEYQPAGLSLGFARKLFF